MPGLNGAQADRAIRAGLPGRQGARPDGPRGQGLPPPAPRRPGASGYVLKRAAAEDLIHAIRAVAAGGIYLDPALAGKVVGGFVRQGRPAGARAARRAERARGGGGPADRRGLQQQGDRRPARHQRQDGGDVQGPVAGEARPHEPRRTWSATPCSGAGWTPEPAVRRASYAGFLPIPIPPRLAEPVTSLRPIPEREPGPCRAAVAAPSAEQRRLGGSAAGGRSRAGHSAGLVSSAVLHRFSETADAPGRCGGPRIAANSAPRRTSSVSRPRGIDRDARRPRTDPGPQAATIHQALHKR